MNSQPTLIIITGPTASGKSALAVELAQRLDTEIISADSRQIYRGIPIVTAVPSLEERGGINHHLLEQLDLQEYYSASKFEEEATDIIKSLFLSHDTAIVCGGSMMYIDALVKGIDELPTVPLHIRERLSSDWKTFGDEWLLNRLKQLDPEYYNKVDRRNLKRVFHAVEISLTAERPYTSLLTGSSAKKDLPFKVVKICLTGEREKLFDRINSRVIRMMEDGLENEARKVYPLRHLNSLNTVGLKEMFAMFEGKFTREEAISRIQKNTRVYAKKQLTWHKRDDEILYLDFLESQKDNTEKILNYINGSIK